MCNKLISALVVCLITHFQLNAQCLGSCCCSANSSVTQGMIIPSKGKLIIGVRMLTMHYKELTDEELLNWAAPNVSVYSVASQWSVSGNVLYGITDKLSAALMLPYNYSAENKEGHYHTNNIAEIHRYGSIRGFGDGSVMVQYKFFGKRDQGWKAFAVAGIKIPTGTTNAYSTYQVVLPVHLQPGTASWDPIAQISLVKSWTRSAFESQVFSRIGTAALEHNMGNYFRADADASYFLLPETNHFISSLSVNAGIEADHNSMMKISSTHNHNGSTQVINDTSATMIVFPNSGFTRLITQASVVCTISNHLIIPLQFSVPVWQHTGGFQAEMVWNASAGLSYSF